MPLLLLHLPLVSSLSGGQQREIIVSKSDTKVFITDYNPSKDYIVNVIAVSGSEQSRPLQGRHKGEFMYFIVWFDPILLLYCVVWLPHTVFCSTVLHPSSLFRNVRPCTSPVINFTWHYTTILFSQIFSAVSSFPFLWFLSLHFLSAKVSSDVQHRTPLSRPLHSPLTFFFLLCVKLFSVMDFVLVHYIVFFFTHTDTYISTYILIYFVLYFFSILFMLWSI